MHPSILSDALRDAATTVDLINAALDGSSTKIEALEAELASRPTQWAYDQACKALHHWRDEARRLGEIAGEAPRQMKHD